MKTDALKLYSLPEAARVLGVSIKTIRRLLDLGRLQAVSIGTHRRIPACSLAAFARGEVGDAEAL